MVDNTFSCSNCSEVFPDTDSFINITGEVVCYHCCTVRCDLCGELCLIQDTDTMWEYGTCCDSCSPVEIGMTEREADMNGNPFDPNE
jgi:hypothetical protein